MTLTFIYSAVIKSIHIDPEAIIKIDISNVFNSGCRVLAIDVLSGRVSHDSVCQRARKQTVDDQHDGCGRIDPETLGHIQSARCTLQAREATSAHHHCWQQVHREITVQSPESKGWTFLTLEGEQSMQTFLKKTCRELYRRTTLTSVQAQEMTDEGE